MDRVTKMVQDLKIVIIRRGLTQKRIAEHLGIESARVSMEVNKASYNRIPKKLLPKFCELLGLSYEKYLEGEVVEL